MAVEERFTSLPTVSSAQLTDIICAVQGYTSPSNLGLSVQETLQQVYEVVQSNVVLFYAGNPNGNLAGQTYQFCWDTANSVLYICTTTGTASTAVWTALNTAAGGLLWNTIAGTTQLAVVNNGYTIGNAAQTTVTLPAVAPLGSIVAIAGQGGGGWILAADASQTIKMAGSTTSAGGSLTSAQQFDYIQVVCSVANTTWVVQSGITTGFTIA